jgi:SAM-dependent methyltransferase
MADANGVSVRVGFFPNVVRPGETFDAIVFNDVFEHLPNLSVAMSEIGRILAPNGLLVINLPLATGVFYRIADTLDRMGCHGPFERMWQLDFPSPHRSYFSQNQLSEIARRYGFEECARYSLPSLRVDGLWERLRYDPNQSVLSAAAMWPLLALVTPFLRFLPPDIGVQIFRRPRPNKL